jgi:thioredoxin-related protein
VLEELHQNYKDKAEMVLITTGNEQKISSIVLLDSERKIRDLYNVRGIPQLFFINKEGKIKSKKIGYDSEKEKETLEEYSKIIQEML